MTVSSSLRAALWTLLCAVALFCGPARAQQPVCPPDAVTVTTTPEPALTSDLLADLRQSAEKAAETNPDLLVLGDSIARDWPVPDLEAALGSKSALNLGFWTDRIQNTLWRVLALNGVAPDARLIVVLVGTNNLIQDEPPCAIPPGIRNLVLKIRETWKAADVVVLGILPRGHRFEFRAADRLKVNEEMRATLSDIPRVAYVDGDEIACASIGADDGYWQAHQNGCAHYSDDLLHLLPAGYEILNRLIAQHWGRLD